MKSLLPVILLSALSIACFHLRAQAPAGDPFLKNAEAAAAQEGKWTNLMLVFELYALPKDDARALLEGEPGSAARYTRVIELMKAGKARFQTLTALVSKSGQRSVNEAIDEVRYATEFEPAHTKGAQAIPLAAETRNVGDTLEFEPVLGPDGRTCDVNLVPQRIALLGFRDVAGFADDPPVSQPLFQTQKVTTSTTLQRDEPHFLGTLSEPSGRGLVDASETSLAFIRMNVIAPGPDDLKPAVKPPKVATMNFEYSFYNLDRAAARELLAAPGVDAAWKKVQELVEAKKARFEHIVSLRTKSGQRAVTEATHEVRYPTEFAAPGVTQASEKTTRKQTTQPGLGEVNPRVPAPRTDASNASTVTETITMTRRTPNSDGTPGAPSAFETRNAGVSVELEPIVGPDGVTIDLNHVFSTTVHLGDLKVAGIGARFPAQPLFETRKFTTSQTLIAGRHMLIGTFNPPGATGVNDRADTGRTWLAFVRCVPSEE